MTARALPQTAEADGLVLLAKCAAADVALLALLHDAEPSAATVESLKACPFAEYLALGLAGADGRAALQAMDLAVAALPAAGDAAGLDAVAADYADVYLRHGFRAAPTESVWLDPDGLERQEPMFQVRKWYRKLGFEPADPAKRPEDHIAHELRFVAAILATEDGGKGALEAAAAFLDEHLLKWTPLLAKQLVTSGAPEVYAALATLTAVYLIELREHLATITGRERPVPAEPATPSKRALPEVPERYVPGLAPSW